MNAFSESLHRIHPHTGAPSHSERLPADFAEPRSAIRPYSLSAYAHSLHSDSPLIQSAKRKLEDANAQPQAADAMCEYYRSRPELKSITITKDVPRLKYKIALGNGHVLSEPKEIQNHFMSSDSKDQEDDAELILRAANQSLLADPIVVLLEEKVVDQRFQATVIAKDCCFFVDLRSSTSEKQRKYVRAYCDLLISTPGVGGPSQETLGLASLRVGVHFSPPRTGAAGALLQYKLLGVKRLVDPSNDLRLFQAAAPEKVILRNKPLLHVPSKNLASMLESMVDTMVVVHKQNSSLHHLKKVQTRNQTRNCAA